jgi:hypothetical protein
MKVFKYTVPQPNDDYVSEVILPVSAQILSVGIQKDEMVIWARVEYPNEPKRARQLIVGNTGVALPFTNGRFIGTVESSGVVWHVFECGN